MKLIMVVALFVVVFSFIGNMVWKEFNKKAGIKKKHFEKIFFFLFQVFTFSAKQTFYLLRFLYREIERRIV